MNRKRIKFGLAILGLLLAFLMGLLAVIFSPTFASADKGSGTSWQEGHGQSGNPAYFELPDTNHSGSNGSGHPGSNPPHGDVGPCAGTPNPCEAWNGPGDGTKHYSEGPDSGPQGGNSGHSSNGDSGNNPQGGQSDQPGPFAGWLPSGGLPGGGGTDGSDTCTKDKSDKSDADSDKDTGKKTCNKTDDGSQQSDTSENQPGDPSGNASGDPADNDPTDGTLGNFSNGFFGSNNPNPPGGGDLPDPNCFPFGDVCGPRNDDPPNTSLTDTPSEIPEPFTLSLFAVGLTGAAALRRSRRKTTGRPLAG